MKDYYRKNSKPKIKNQLKMNEKNLKHKSKFLSLVLRHKPEAIDLKLDKNGWADIEELIEKAKANGKFYDMAILEEVVESNNKKRFRN